MRRTTLSLVVKHLLKFNIAHKDTTRLDKDTYSRMRRPLVEHKNTLRALEAYRIDSVI